MRVFAKRAYLPSQWARDVRITISGGEIAEITQNSQPETDDIQVDTLLPALSNLHSHSFQRAMAGMSEFRTNSRESFWTWRDLMYRFLDHLTPDHIGAIAALAFMEMQKAGFCAVGEFHYLHHAQGGARYDDRAELSGQIMQAAEITGIGLTHLPVLYSYGDVGGAPLSGGQLRFGNTLDQFLELVARCDRLAAQHNQDTKVGIAPHSLRAISPDDLAQLLQNRPEGPVHIHIAEQIKEVESVQNALSARPVEWLLANADINARWCLIHATHMSPAETRALAKSGAVAGLCPVTEANLGDGTFNGAQYLAEGGCFGIGTDSNINISLTEELRMFEYSQRLIQRERNVICHDNAGTGATLFDAAASGGARALGRNSGCIAVGKLADLTAIDSTDLRLCALREDQLLEGYNFGACDSVVSDVWCAGRHTVRQGRHVAQDAIERSYRNVISELLAEMG